MLKLLKIFLLLCVLCVVCTQSDYVRVKRGRYYSSPPQRFYSRPPISPPVQGIFSNTPPPFMQDEAPYPGRRPYYKVSTRPTNDALGDEDIINLMNHLSKNDLNKIIEFAAEKSKEYPENDAGYKPFYKRETKYKNIYKGYIDSHEKEIDNYSYKPSYSRDSMNKNVYKTSVDTNYNQDDKEVDNYNYKPYTRESVNKNVYKTYLDPKPQEETEENSNFNYKQYLNGDNKHKTAYKAETKPNDEKLSPEVEFKEVMQYLNFVTRPTPTALEFYRPQESKTLETPSSQIGVFGLSPSVQDYVQNPSSQLGVFGLSPSVQNYGQNQIPVVQSGSTGSSAYIQEYESSQPIPQTQENTFGTDFAESNEEEKLPLPDNMRAEDFITSYTNNVPTFIKSGSYQLENFGDLPLMDYHSKLETVNSYSVPHYTVTKQSKPASYSSPSQLKPSSGSSHIQAPPVEPAPPLSAAQEQSDAHLKAIKIWSHKSKGAAYTLHDDGTLTPERSGRPIYG